MSDSLSLIGIVANTAGKFAGVFYGWVFGETVKYRDTVKLRHTATSRSLHSHSINYRHPGSSGQQQVTGFDRADSNDYWIIKGPDGLPETYKEGISIKNGDIVRLEHLKTKRNLHSHRGIPSPLTQQQEVTAFGDDGVGDYNDNWRVEVEFGGEWRRNIRIRLIHVDTEHALHSHRGYSHSLFTEGQQEVTCYEGRNDDDWWQISSK